MEIGYILNELWRRRTWVGVGLLVSVVVGASVLYKLPSLEKKSLELGAASTEILVDAPRSPLGALNSDVATLVTRGGIYARLISSTPVRVRISEELGISNRAIATRGPQPRANQKRDERGRETSSEERGTELLAEGNEYRVHANAGAEIPVVTISAQAPSGPEAIRLADATAQAITGYVQEIQVSQDIPAFARVQIRQLGPAQGGTINQGVDKSAAALAFAGAFVAWCLLLLFVANAAASWRDTRAAEAARRDEMLDRSIADEVQHDGVAA